MNIVKCRCGHPLPIYPKWKGGEYWYCDKCGQMYDKNISDWTDAKPLYDRWEAAKKTAKIAKLTKNTKTLDRF